MQALNFCQRCILLCRCICRAWVAVLYMPPWWMPPLYLYWCAVRCALCECVHFCVSCAVQGLYPGNKPCCADAIAVARLQLLCCMYDTLCRRSLSCAALDFDFEVLNSWYAVGGVSWSVLGPQPARPACMLHYSDTGVFEWVCMGQASHIQAG